ncbi:unnamed protein product [Mytilus coruscus]|uniref:Uncharacterized protein n=1 Tax=Mytilus coruscus TaxID=42192 RepID=A0A6J8ARJ0_MYTCO|nr:unnamed protein product [Mytilus coruscus]
MILGTKTDLLSQCLEPLTTSTGDVPEVDVLVIDGAAIVNMLKPSTSRTFDNYADLIFCPYIRKHLETVARVDVVWDAYIDNSLKAATRSKRGKGIRRRVQGKNKIPQNLQSFLRDDDNKKELCSHKDADTRIMVHVSDAVKHGLKRVMIRTADTDVAVIAVSLFHEIGADELRLAFGSGKSFRYISIHDLSNALGIEISHRLPVFHAFTRCDTVSSFAGKGKKTAWETWMAFEDVK